MDRGKQWLKRFGCFLLILLWLVAMIFPTFAFVLAGTGQIQLGSEPGSNVRFFMVNEEDANGIGVQVKRPSSSTPSSKCYQNNLVYLLWEGDATGQNSSFCTCYDPNTNASLPVEENSCSP